jgi:hypothetical protein
MPGRLALRLAQDIGQVAKVRLLCRLDDLGAQVMGAEHAKPAGVRSSGQLRTGLRAHPDRADRVLDPSSRQNLRKVLTRRLSPPWRSGKASFSCAGRRLLAANPKPHLTSRFTIDG